MQDNCSFIQRFDVISIINLQRYFIFHGQELFTIYGRTIIQPVWNTPA